MYESLESQARKIQAAESPYRDYISERASNTKRRGLPSERYAISHPYPTYSQFGNPQFVDTKFRMYRIGDGQDAKYHYEHSSADPLWNPGDKSHRGSSGSHLLYMKIKKGTRNRDNDMGFPESDETLYLIHLSSKRIYSCTVNKVSGHDYGRSNTGTVVADSIKHLGRANEDLSRRIKQSLPSLYKPLIKLSS